MRQRWVVVLRKPAVESGELHAALERGAGRPLERLRGLKRIFVAVTLWAVALMFTFSRLVRREHEGMELRRQRKSSSSAVRGPRLDRRNAAKNIDYEAVGASWASTSSDESSLGALLTRSFDRATAAYANKKSFRIEGAEGEVDLLCRSLGLSGPDDFAIPAAAWEARKARSSSDLLPRSRLLDPQPSPSPPTTSASAANNDGFNAEIKVPEDITKRDSTSTSNTNTARDRDRDRGGEDIAKQDSILPSNSNTDRVWEGGDGRGKINGVRPPPVLSPRLRISVLPVQFPANSALALPPAISLPVLDDDVSSTWDIIKSFAPKDEDGSEQRARRSIDSKEEEESGEEEEEVEEQEDEGVVGDGVDGEEEVRVGEVGGDGVEGEEVVRVGETMMNFTGSTSCSVSKDEMMFVISPNGRFKRNIKSWQRGVLLGSGSFGTVYEGISNDGFFFAVKEVSLLDQGSNAEQWILQLEQEIALLSQFEHDNIVQYYGSDKEEAKLYIFLELVTQGSLASLYQKYHLRDSQVSVYTRQILNGLSYLHDRSVVHRDIKCANILVDANGSVKLADFGLAKEITKLNVLKSCKGSVYWMAPEVVNPRRTYGPSADIWSLGCTVLEMLTRQIPYPNLEWAQALYRIGQGESPTIPDSLSKEARDFIRQCVQINPDDRPSASELLGHPFVKRPLLVSTSSDGSSHPSYRS